jgi:hypothetical protein
MRDYLSRSYNPENVIELRALSMSRSTLSVQSLDSNNTITVNQPMGETKIHKRSFTIVGILQNRDLRWMTFVTSFVLLAQVACGIGAVEIYSASIFLQFYEKDTAEFMTAGLSGLNVVSIYRNSIFVFYIL